MTILCPLCSEYVSTFHGQYTDGRPDGSILVAHHKAPVYRKDAYQDVVEIGSFDALAFVKTTNKLYISHISWIPAVNKAQAMRIREVYSQGDLSTYEIASLFGMTQTLIQDIILGKHRLTRGLHHIKRGFVYKPRESKV